MAQDVETLREQERLYNFLKKYDLHQYYQKLTMKGVHRLTHLKAVLADEASLDEIGLSRIERVRLRKKVKENVAWRGRIVKKLTRKENRFNGHIPELTQHTTDASNEGRRSATIIPRDEVNLTRKIGEGAHGSVHEGSWADVHGAVAVAVKTLFRKQEVQQFIKEVNSMATLHHKHIIQLYGIVLSQPLMLVEELAPFGSLQSYLQKEGEHVTLTLLHTYISQIADAMAYLESRRIVHRDLAIRNILLSQVNYVKLSDFGMARVLDDNSEVYNLSNLATRIPVAWTAPEAMMQAQFSSASDIWSYGVSVWEIYSLGKVPWKGLGPVEIRDLLMEGQRLGRPERCPEEVFEMMQACWKENPQKRPNFAKIQRDVQLLVPRQVRAVKSHLLGDDPNSLSFKTGDLIYIIEKSSPEWMTGMKTDGSIGHFRADFVSNIINPLDEIRAKVASGRTNVSALTIGSPTDVDHNIHYYHDGSKWVSEEARELDPTPPDSPVQFSKPGRSSSDTSDTSPKASDSRQPMSPKSPLATSSLTASAGPGGTTRHNQPYPLPYQLPITRMQEGPCPPHRTTSSSKMTPPTRASTLPLGLGRANTGNSASTPEAHDQYISMKRVAANSFPLGVLPTQHNGNGNQPAKRGGPEDPYVLMQSWSVKEKGRSVSTSDGWEGPTQGAGKPKGKRNSSVSEAYSSSRDKSPHFVDNEEVGGDWASQLPRPRQEIHLPDIYDEDLWRGGADEDGGRGRGDEDDGDNESCGRDESPPPGPDSEADSAFLDASHYKTPSSISTSHYSIPSSLPAKDVDASLDHTHLSQSLLDASNFDPTPNLPEPLVPSASPSPTKAPGPRGVLSGLYSPTSASSSASPGQGRDDSIPLSPSYMVHLQIRDSDDDLLAPEVAQGSEVTQGSEFPQATTTTTTMDQPQSIAQPVPRPRPATQPHPKVQPPVAKPRSGLAEKTNNGSPTMTPATSGPPTVTPATSGPPTVTPATSGPPTMTSSVAARESPTVSHKPKEASDATRPLTLPPGSRSTYQSLIPGTLSSISGDYVTVDPKSQVPTENWNENRKSGHGSAQGNGRSGRGSVQGNGGSGRGSAQGNRRSGSGRSQRVDESASGRRDDILEEILTDEEFIGCEMEICRFALEQHDFDIGKAKEEVRVQILLGMLLPNIREEDCRRALVHCQQKTNRAAAWLLQKSEDISINTL